uniref:Uncharacterized protein n=1 Tax=Romanomermis culicivorax TaxID=13658 RepID=A0A915IW04_ROMCU
NDCTCCGIHGPGAAKKRCPPAEQLVNNLDQEIEQGPSNDHNDEVVTPNNVSEDDASDGSSNVAHQWLSNMMTFLLQMTKTIGDGTKSQWENGLVNGIDNVEYQDCGMSHSGHSLEIPKQVDCYPPVKNEEKPYRIWPWSHTLSTKP